jgi:hypothetical protein
MRRVPTAGRYAERTLTGLDDGGAAERIVIWIERREGGVWAVGRAVNPQHRSSSEPHPDDWLFEGYELGDALAAANGALAADLEVSRGDGGADRVRPFGREEVLTRLERWFFGHAAS